MIMTSRQFNKILKSRPFQPGHSFRGVQVLTQVDQIADRIFWISIWSLLAVCVLYVPNGPSLGPTSRSLKTIHPEHPKHTCTQFAHQTVGLNHWPGSMDQRVMWVPNPSLGKDYRFPTENLIRPSRKLFERRPNLRQKKHRLYIYYIYMKDLHIYMHKKSDK